ncbi:Hypothetical predicted protein [Cloeon dipterum]|uniref:Uncharacterized protein n=1 Tax=Cloeon dipterum TaxID=197152 RepID=A0A8S1E6U2_9INSE|nr:Hypothetical predicted protein [Cloeon dipterum]
MSYQKALCLICELPTADGAVSAVHVDKEKLKTWFLNACEYELAEEIEDDDLICYFCVCHAEFQWKFDEMADENLVWWNLELDDAARELRKNYFEGNLEQCWVQLEKIKLPESESEDDGRPIEAKQQKCTRKPSDVKIAVVQLIFALLKKKKSTQRVFTKAQDNGPKSIVAFVERNLRDRHTTTVMFATFTKNFL